MTPDLEDQSLEEMCAALSKAGIKVTAKGIAAKLNRRFNEEFLRAQGIQLKAAKAQGVRKIIRLDSGESVGEIADQIVPALYMGLVRRHGLAAMKDDEFRRDLVKAHPELRVKTVNDRLTIVKPVFGAKSRAGVHGRRGRWAA